MGCVNETLIENSKYNGNDNNSRFYETLCWFNIHCNK